MPSLSKAQQRLMGQAYAVRKGDLDLKDIDPEYRDEIEKLSKGMKKKDLESFAKTKHKNLPERIPESLSDFMNENNPTATTDSVNGMGDVKLPQGDIPGSGDIPHQLTGATAEDDTVEESYKEGADLFVKELEKSNLLKGTNLKVSEGPSRFGAPGEARFRDHVTISGIGTMTELYIIPRGSVGQYELYTDKSYESGREIKVGDAKTIIKSMKRYINKMSKESVNEAKDEVYLKTLADSDYFAKGYETLFGLQSSIKRILGDREISPDESDVLDAINWLKDGLGNGDPRKTSLGKKLLKMKWVTESVNEAKVKGNLKKIFGDSISDMDLDDNLNYIVQGDLDKIRSIAKKKKINIEDVENWGIRIFVESITEAKYNVGDKIKYSIPYYDEPKDGEGVIKTVHKDGEKYSLEGGGVIYPNEIKGIAESSLEYFKSFEEFRINEQSRMKRHITDVSKKLKDFFSAVGNESKETAQVVKLLYKANKEDRDLTKAEKDQVKNQLKDVLKTIGLGSLAIMPGGFVVAVILKALKLNDKIIPSSFKKK